MNINKKIVSFIILSCTLAFLAFIFNSIYNLKQSQTNNIQLFKGEFLELGRELFTKSSSSFFDNLDMQIKMKNSNVTSSQAIINFIKETDPNKESLIIVDIKDGQFIEGYGNSNSTSFFGKSAINNYLGENILNQKIDFDLDNFNLFEQDITNTIIPNKIHFRVYSDAGIMVGFEQSFLTGKTRIDFIERQNQSSFVYQMYSSVTISVIILIFIVILAIIFMRRIVIVPLEKIINVVKVITAGDLNKKIEIKSKDEMGQLGVAFNEMTSKLKESNEILEVKIEERTKELEEERGNLEKKVSERTTELEELKNALEKTVEERTEKLNAKLAEMERMNKLMVGRELNIIDFKKEIRELKSRLEVKG